MHLHIVCYSLFNNNSDSISKNMDCIKIIHIGDIHYPENFNKPLADLKDRGLSGDFINDIAPNPFDKVSKEIIRTLNNEDISAILLSGDLTSYGQLDGYERCVAYFKSIFDSYLNGSNPVELHVVPGNHDLDRSAAGTTDKFKKFSDFVDVWKKNGADILKPEDVRISNIDKNGSKVKLFSLNTCIGCGETRHFPERIREQVEEIISKGDINDSVDFEIFAEQLDTPAATQNHIDEIEDSIKDCSIDSIIPIILGHHGLLPQAIVRTEIYTEMINSGHIRSLFSSLDYPVVYCHGHIHDGPVETITQPIYEKSNLITISAPEFSSGFNIIEFYFTEKKKPIGCVIRPKRIKTFGGIRDDEKIRIRLQRSQDIDEYCNGNVELLYKHIPGKDVYFSEIVNHKDTMPLSLSENEISTILKELEWIGVISISNRERDHKHWIIKRIGL